MLLSGLLTSIGGVYLVFEQRQFVALMSGGRGFLALAAMIFGGWRPLPAAAAAVLFAAAEALGIKLQASNLHVPNYLLQALPYVLTLLALLLRGVLRGASPARPLSASRETKPMRLVIVVNRQAKADPRSGPARSAFAVLGIGAGSWP